MVRRRAPCCSSWPLRLQLQPLQLQPLQLLLVIRIVGRVRALRTGTPLGGIILLSCWGPHARLATLATCVGH